MQENRSFDHYFGTMKGVRGFDDPTAITLSTGKSVFYQPDAVNPDGYLLPFHLDTKSSSAQAIPSTSHAWSVQHQAWNNGKMDQWLPAHRAADKANGPYVMGYYNRDDIPFQFALAEAFTIGDHYHCGVFGPTWPNRMMWMTGTIDPAGLGGGPIISNVAPKGGYTWTTYAERLQQAQVSWKVYQTIDNYGCNMLENFKPFLDAKPGDPLYDRGVSKGHPNDFEDDVRNDRLPTVSWLIPTSYESEHPNYLPAAGADFVARKIEALASNPKVWRKTAFILNYDENDGLFDHVVPPTPPAGTAGEFIGGLADWCRLSGAAGDRVAVDRRRLGGDRELRPHFGVAFPGKTDRRARAEHQRLAAGDVRGPHVRFPVPVGSPVPAAAAGHPQAAAAGAEGGLVAARADPAWRRPDPAEAGAGHPPAHSLRSIARHPTPAGRGRLT